MSYPNSSVIRAGTFMVLAMASFVSNDTMVKLVGKSLPVGEIITVRGVMSTLILLGICAYQGVLDALPMVKSRHVVTRATMDLIATILFIMALMHMQLANLTAILQVVPLAVALLSIILLGERVSWQRMAAIVIGFIGVLLIVKPSPSSFTLYDGFALFMVALLGVRDIATRRIPARIPTFVIALANALFVTLGGAVLWSFQGFVMPEPWQIATLACAAVFLSSGYLFMVATLRAGDLSATAPFRYSILIFAIFYGVVIFREIPDFYAILGMALIAGTGIYAAHRETRLSSSARTPAP